MAKDQARLFDDRAGSLLPLDRNAASLAPPTRIAGWWCFAIVLLFGAVVAALAAANLSGRPANALPLYARQTGQPCAACHTAFPELTPFGRRFKLGGYTLGGGDSSLPFSGLLQPSFPHSDASQPTNAAPQPGAANMQAGRRSGGRQRGGGGAAPSAAPNDELVLEQGAVFTGGGISDTLGAFVRRDKFNYYPSANPFADLAPGLQQETLSQKRTLTNVGIRSDISRVKGIHLDRIGKRRGKRKLMVVKFRVELMENGFAQLRIAFHQK